MSRKLMILGGVLVATLTIGSVCTAGEPTYNCHVVILKTPTSTAQFQAEQMIRRGASLTASGNIEIRWDRTTLTSDGESLRLNGEELKLQPAAARSQTGDVTVLATPRVFTRQSQDVGVSAGTQERVQYFKRESDDRFSLQTIVISPKLDLHLKVDAGSKPDTLHLTWSYKLVQIGGRKKIPGVSLDVGPPGINEQSGHLEGDVQAGRYCLITLDQDDLVSGLLIFLKITESS